jgi:hypothetical protein
MSARTPRRDLPDWAWRLSGKAGGTGNGYAVTYKAIARATIWNAARPPVPAPRPNPRLDNWQVR